MQFVQRSKEKEKQFSTPALRHPFFDFVNPFEVGINQAGFRSLTSRYFRPSGAPSINRDEVMNVHQELTELQTCAKVPPPSPQQAPSSLFQQRQGTRYRIYIYGVPYVHVLLPCKSTVA